MYAPRTVVLIAIIITILSVAACGSSRGSSGPSGSKPATGGSSSSSSTAKPSIDSPASIKDLWCALSVGDSKAQVLAAMPPPRGSKVAIPSGFDAVEWDQGNDIFLATFTAGKVTNLQAYSGAVGPAGATDLPCPAFRHS